MDFLNLEDLQSTYITQELSDSATTVYVDNALDGVDPPFLVTIARGRDLSSLINGEKVRVSAKDSVNPKMWTITRGYDGSTARLHTPGELVLMPYSAAHHKMIQGAFEFLAYAFGRGASGVIRKDSADPGNLYVAATTGMVVKVKAGLALINRKPFKLAADTELTVEAPSSGTRIALVQANLITNTVELKYGDAPTADTDCLALAEISTEVEMSDIIQDDITDKRIFY